ncbi:hypothetical protein D3C75_751260 [compost metagenome]
MGNDQQHGAQRLQQPVAGEHQQGQAQRGGAGGADPPGLALSQVGGCSTWQFRRQAQGRGQAEHGEAGQAPQCAGAGTLGFAQAVQGGEDQGEADRDHQVAASGGQHPLPAIFRRPGFGAVFMGGHFAGMLVLGDRGRGFVGFCLEDQRGDPEALQQGQQQGRQ